MPKFGRKIIKKDLSKEKILADLEIFLTKSPETDDKNEEEDDSDE